VKVLFITHYSDMYGANKSFADLVLGLRDKGVEPIVLIPKKGFLNSFFEKENIKVKTLFFYPWVLWSRKYYGIPFKILYNLIKYPYLILFIKKNKFDLIYSNSSVVQIGAVLSFLLKIPHIWHIREFGTNDYNITYYVPKLLRKLLYKKAKFLIAISKAIKKESTFGLGKNTIQIYNGIIEKPRNVSIKKIKESRVVFGIVGRLMPTKGQHIALKAFNEYAKFNSNTFLYIVGDSGLGFEDYERELRQYVVANKLSDKVEFTGFIRDVDQIYKNLHIYLMCSLSEGMGRVTVEALSYGLPIIGYNGGATPEIIEHNKNGFLYEGFEDISSISKLMNRITSSDDLYNRMQIAAHKSSMRFTKQNYVNSIYNLIIK